jgi:hypothetical protein
MSILRIDRWPPSELAKSHATLDALWIEVERLLCERDAAFKRLDRVRELLRCETSRQLCSYEHNRADRGPCRCRTCSVYREEGDQ